MIVLILQKRKFKEATNSRKDTIVKSLIYQFTVDVLNDITYFSYKKERWMLFITQQKSY